VEAFHAIANMAFEAPCCAPQGRAGADRRAGMSRMRHGGEPVSSGRRRAGVPALLQWCFRDQGAVKPAHTSEVQRCMPPAMHGCVEVVKKIRSKGRRPCLPPSRVMACRCLRGDLVQELARKGAWTPLKASRRRLSSPFPLSSLPPVSLLRRPNFISPCHLCPIPFTTRTA
jgi:hypothetical protein